MKLYQQITASSWLRTSDNVVVNQGGNADYVALQAWLAAGNVPDDQYVPAQITRWQAMQVMASTPSRVHASPATLLTDVQAIVTATGGLMQLAWVNQLYLYRNGPFLTPALMAAVGLNPADVDRLFVAAVSLPP